MCVIQYVVNNVQNLNNLNQENYVYWEKLLNLRKVQVQKNVFRQSYRQSKRVGQSQNEKQKRNFGLFETFCLLNMKLQYFNRLRNLITQFKEQIFTNKAITGISRQNAIWIQNQIKEKNLDLLMNLKHLFKEFLIKFAITETALSLSKFRKIVKDYAKCLYRLPIKRDIRASGRNMIEQRFDFALFFITQIQNQAIHIFIDESSLGHNVEIPKIWQGRDQLKIIDCYKPTSTIGILGAISQNGYLAYQILIGTVNGEVYAQHLIKLYKNGSNHYSGKNLIFIFDNSRVHHCKKFKKS